MFYYGKEHSVICKEFYKLILYSCEFDVNERVEEQAPPDSIAEKSADEP